MASRDLSDTLPSSSRLALGPFALGHPLGTGAMGRVFAARHAPTGTPVAIKVLDARCASPAHHEAFRREVALTAGLDHPSIVRVLDFGEVPRDAPRAVDEPAPGAPYLVMAYADRGSLADAGGALDWPSVAAVLFAVLDGLAHAHARGCVHCDLKPENVLLATVDGAIVPWIADFGIAHAFRQDPRTATAGTPAYMAPEQFLRPRDIGPWTDLYALGCVAWHLVCHGLPYRARTPAAWAIAHVTGERAPARPALVGVPQAFVRWLDGMLARDWRTRYRSAAAAAAALARVVAPGSRIELPVRDPLRPITAPAPIAADDTTASLHTLDWITLPTMALPEGGPAHGERPPLPPDWRRAVRQASDATLLAGAGRALFGLRALPFVGRAAERDRIWAALAAVHRGGGVRVVVLRGAPGTGKSRLAQWMAERADEVGGGFVVDLRHGSTPGPGDGVRGALSRLVAPLGDSDDVDRVRRLRGGAEVEALDGAIVRLCGDEASGPGLLPAQRHALAARFLLAVAAGRPLVVWVDDAQWGEDALGFVGALLGADADALVLVTARDDLLGERPVEAALIARICADARAEVIGLAPLDRATHAELVRRVLPLDRVAVDHVVARTEGNPLFAVQLVGEWLARGALVEGADGFAVRPEALGALPGDVHALWGERLAALTARLGPAARAAIELGAALGERVDRAEWLACCAEAAVPVPAELWSFASRAGLVRAAPGGWRFAHGLLRDSTLRLAAEGHRLAHHHRACATTLARLGRGDSPAHAQRGANHRIAAGQPAAALEPLREAAWLHIDRMHRDEVRPLIARHDALLDAIGAPADDARRARSGVIRAFLAFADADLPATRRAFDAVRPLVERHRLEGEIGRLLRLRGMMARQAGDHETAWRALCSAEQQLDAAGLFVEAGKAALGRIELSRARDDVEGCRAAIDAAELRFAQASDGFWHMTVRIERVRLLRWLGELDAADRLVMAVAADARRAGDETNESRALHTGAVIARMRRDLPAAHLRLRQAAELYGRTNNINRWVVHGDAALLALLDGDLALAVERAARTDAELTGTMWADSQPVVHLVLAIGALRAGDAAAADARMERFAGRIAIGPPDPIVADGASICAEALAAIGETARALRAAGWAVDSYAALGNPAAAARIAARHGIAFGG
ncbi:MAG: protein kinase [bacterium]